MLFRRRSPSDSLSALLSFHGQSALRQHGFGSFLGYNRPVSSACRCRMGKIQKPNPPVAFRRCGGCGLFCNLRFAYSAGQSTVLLHRLHCGNGIRFGLSLFCCKISQHIKIRCKTYTSVSGGHKLRTRISFTAQLDCSRRNCNGDFCCDLRHKKHQKQKNRKIYFRNGGACPARCGINCFLALV